MGASALVQRVVLLRDARLGVRPDQQVVDRVVGVLLLQPEEEGLQRRQLGLDGRDGSLPLELPELAAADLLKEAVDLPAPLLEPRLICRLVWVERSA